MQNKEQQIFRAVIDGTIRAKHKGRILTTEEAAALGKTRWDAENSYALPPDIQLSVEDALLIFKLARIASGCASGLRPCTHKSGSALPRNDVMGHNRTYGFARKRRSAT